VVAAAGLRAGVHRARVAVVAALPTAGDPGLTVGEAVAVPVGEAFVGEAVAVVVCAVADLGTTKSLGAGREPDLGLRRSQVPGRSEEDALARGEVGASDVPTETGFGVLTTRGEHESGHKHRPA